MSGTIEPITDNAPRAAILSPGVVTIGTDLHNWSVADAIELHNGVSAYKSVKWLCAKYSATGTYKDQSQLL